MDIPWSSRAVCCAHLARSQTRQCSHPKPGALTLTSGGDSKGSAQVASEKKNPSKAPGETSQSLGFCPCHCSKHSARTLCHPPVPPQAPQGHGHWGLQAKPVLMGSRSHRGEALAAPKAVVASPPSQISLLPSKRRHRGISDSQNIPVKDCEQGLSFCFSSVHLTPKPPYLGAKPIF